MGDISAHFNRQEFACRCGCGFAVVDKKLNEVLEDIRNHFNMPLIINSACRCPDYNEKVGGAKQSQHVLGMAADIVVMNVHPDRVFGYIKKAHKACSTGRYNSFTHIDVRNVVAHWDERG